MSDYRPVTDVWMMARPKVKYWGAYPSGFLERAVILLGVSPTDQLLRQLAREGLVTRVGAAKKWALVPIANIQSQKSTPVSPPAPVIREAEELLEDDELLAEDVDGLDDAAFEADVAPERRARPSLRQDTAKSEVAKGASWWLTAGRDHFTMAAEGQLTRMRLSKESQRGRYRAIEDE